MRQVVDPRQAGPPGHQQALPHDIGRELQRMGAACAIQSVWRFRMAAIGRTDGRTENDGRRATDGRTESEGLTHRQRRRLADKRRVERAKERQSKGHALYQPATVGARSSPPPPPESPPHTPPQPQADSPPQPTPAPRVNRAQTLPHHLTLPHEQYAPVPAMQLPIAADVWRHC